MYKTSLFIILFFISLIKSFKIKVIIRIYKHNHIIQKNR